jgi:hypothetical protein
MHLQFARQRDPGRPKLRVLNLRRATPASHRATRSSKSSSRHAVPRDSSSLESRQSLTLHLIITIFAVKRDAAGR